MSKKIIYLDDAIDAIVAWTVEDRPDIEMPTDLVGRINALPSAQSNEQIMWERDVAVEQLRQLGYGFGEVIRIEKDRISRRAAIDLVRDVCDAIMSFCGSHYDEETKDEVYDDILEVDAILKCNKEIRIALKNMPSAQPLTAYVISDEDGNIKCSNCGSFECWGNYCMNCGAKMGR